MRLRSLLCLCLLSVLAVPGLASAQAQRQPHGGAMALGGDIGFYVSDEELNVTYTPQAYVEFYPTDRWSIRAMVAYHRPDYTDGARSLDQWTATFNVTHNWEYDYWHPYVSVGVGFYSVQYIEGDSTYVGPRYTKAGANIAAGIEYFWSPKVAIKFEVDVHIVRPVMELGSGSEGMALTAGIKRYF